MTVSPSVILCRDEDLETLWESLSAVAPVLPVGSTSTGTPWQKDLTFIADATSRSERGAEILADHDTRFAELQDTNTDLWQSKVAVISYSGDGIAFNPNRIMWSTLIDLGVTFSDTQSDLVASGESHDFSPEEVQLAVGDCDLLMISVNEDDVWEQWRDDPLWSQLPAVSAGHFVRTDKHTNEGGPLTALHCLDKIEELYSTLR